MKIEGMQIHFFSDVFAAVTVFGAWGPYVQEMHCTIPFAST